MSVTQTKHRKEYMKRYHRMWYLKNRKRILDEQRGDPNRAAYLKKYSPGYRAKNKDKLAKAKQEYYLKNKERIAAYKKEYARNNRAVINAYFKKWGPANYVKDPAKAHLLYYARKTKTLAKITKEEIPNWYSRICGICNHLITGRFHIDHHMPLSRGGKHIASNLRLAHPFCNSSKNNKLISLNLLPLEAEKLSKPSN